MAMQPIPGHPGLYRDVASHNVVQTREGFQMPVEPIFSQPGLYRDTDSGQVLSAREYRPFEISADLHRKRVSDRLKPQPGESWWVKRWSIVIHPWHEVIPPSITVDLVVNELLLVRDMPLFRVAEPLRRSKDDDLLQRIARLEAKLGVAEDLDAVRGISQLINQNHEVCAKLHGSADELSPLFEMTKHFMLSLQGLSRSLTR